MYPSTYDVDVELALTEQHSHPRECREHEEVFVAIKKLANLQLLCVIQQLETTEWERNEESEVELIGCGSNLASVDRA